MPAGPTGRRAAARRSRKDCPAAPRCPEPGRRSWAWRPRCEKGSRSDRCRNITTTDSSQLSALSGGPMPTPITKKGYEALKADLDRLRKEERPKVIEAIAEARSHGDLSENAEYEAAKERQGFIEARIHELERKLAEARIIETANLSSETV